MARGYQNAAVVMAAAELELFDRLAGGDFTAEGAASRLSVDLRALATLLDALAAIQLLDKRGDRYGVPPGVEGLLTAAGRGSFLALVQHHANCMRRWTNLARVVQTGQPAHCEASVRGEAADLQAFIDAMDNLADPIATRLIAELPVPPFTRLLDVGGASGSWTIAFLRRDPEATAILFDLAAVIPQAEGRISASGLRDRVELVAGDFYVDVLPDGADLVWVSAIVHQNSRQQNRELFAAVHRASLPGGHVLIRDIVMDESRTAPIAGALFAVNMLVGTHHGGTFTLSELREDLEYAGFVDVRLLRSDEGMHSVVQAIKG
jgi:precorrin-6B methylase 2